MPPCGNTKTRKLTFCQLLFSILSWRERCSFCDYHYYNKKSDQIKYNMLFIFGTTIKYILHPDNLELTHICPNCTHTMRVCNAKEYFSLFFIPIFPIRTIATVYHCNTCKADYDENVKTVNLQFY